ncbi:MAG: tetratricopeptide repeat protein, partial [Pirellulaceae bacterium]|nr:tetratricopeptide repeat protein [Pirellulaceae bacterium]
PKYADPWTGLGNLLKSHLGRYEEAEQAYRRACELDPKSADPWNGLGNLLQTHLGRYEEAEQAYRRACELDPKSADPWNGLGNLLMDCMERPAEAEQAYRKAMEIDPTDDSPRHNLVYVLRDLRHDFRTARRLLSELAEPSRWNDAQALHEALFLAYDDNWGLARESLRSALAEVSDSLPSNTRDDWCRASAVIVHLGFGPQLLEFLVEQGADVRLMPWFEAVQAHVVGDERHLGNIPAEARVAAAQIYAAIDRWRRLLPSRPGSQAARPQRKKK